MSSVWLSRTLLHLIMSRLADAGGKSGLPHYICVHRCIVLLIGNGSADVAICCACVVQRRKGFLTELLIRTLCIGASRT